MADGRSTETVKWFAGIVASVIAAVLTAWVTSTLTLRSQSEEGHIVFNNIGIRYFAAVAASFSQETGLAIVGQRDAYVAILNDIREDIRWLRTNRFIARSDANLVLVQNALAAEQAVGGPGISEVTLRLMCGTYVESKLWRPGTNEGEIERDLRELARRLCARYAPE